MAASTWARTTVKRLSPWSATGSPCRPNFAPRCSRWRSPAAEELPGSLAVKLAEALMARHGGNVSMAASRGTETRVVATFPLAPAAPPRVSSPS